MPMFVFVLLFNFVAHLVRGAKRNSQEARSEPLCVHCSHAHVQYGTNARRAVSCAYGGNVHPVKLDVLYCTDYQARVQPAPRAIGFLYQIAPVEAGVSPNGCG